MKLYATVTSERAQKSQGGNNFVEVQVRGEDRNTIIAGLRILPDDTNYRITIFDGKGYNTTYIPKGEKGRCNLCYKASSHKATNGQAWEYCEEHYKELQNLKKGEKQKGEKCWHESIRKENGKEICNKCNLTLSASIG